MSKQRDKACKQDIHRILLLDSDSLGFESFGFGILNCPSLLIGMLVWFIKITKVIPFEFIKVLHKDPFLALYFSLHY